MLWIENFIEDSLAGDFMAKKWQQPMNGVLNIVTLKDLIKTFENTNKIVLLISEALISEAYFAKGSRKVVFHDFFHVKCFFRPPSLFLSA